MQQKNAKTLDKFEQKHSLLSKKKHTFLSQLKSIKSQLKEILEQECRNSVSTSQDTSSTHSARKDNRTGRRLVQVDMQGNSPQSSQKLQSEINFHITNSR